MPKLISIKAIIFNVILLLVGLLFFTTSNNVVYAQAGVSVSPALIEETLDPGFSKDYTIEVENLLNSKQTFYLSTRNISDVRPGGVPVFAREDSALTGMELADWIEIEIKEVTLEGNQKTVIPFTLNVPESASPGSHFGGVFISVDAPEIEQSGAAVGYQVANIVSIRVSGDVVEQASIRQFSTENFLYSNLDIDFQVRIENSGNVLVKPFGPVEITNMLGQEVDSFIFNEEAASIPPKFPNSTNPETNGIREFVFNWTGEGVGFGRYEVLLSAIYGEEGAQKTMSSTASFWVLPMNIIGPALAVLAILLLIVFVVVKMYINRTVAQLSGGRTRMVRSRRRSGPSPVVLLTVVMLVVIALFMIVLLALFA